MKIAIVTGASSGLGRAGVQRLDALGGLDEIWGVARRGGRMEELAGRLSTPMRCLALDLAKQERILELRDLLEREGPDVRAVSYTHLDVYKRQELPGGGETEE